MIKRLVLAACLLCASAPGWAYTVSAFHDGQALPFLVEGDGAQTVTVQIAREFGPSGEPLDPASACQVEVVVRAGGFNTSFPGDQATASVDYVAGDRRLNLLIGSADLSSSVTFDVPVIDDTLAEPTEFFAAEVLQVDLIECDPVSQFSLDAEQPVPIFDDDLPGTDGVVEFANLPLSVSEDAGTATIVVNRIDGGQGEISYQYFVQGISATEGEDFTSDQNSLIWLDGDTTPKSFVIQILDDTLLEGDEVLQILLTSPIDPEAPLGAALTIVDNEAPSVLQFSVTDIRVHENSQVAEAIVTRTGPLVGEVSVGYSTEPGTATDGEDYEGAGGSLTWGDNDGAPRSIFVTILPGQVGTAGETFTIRLFEPGGPAVLGANEQLTVLIEPFAPGQLVVLDTPLTVAENAGVATIVLERVGGSDSQVVVDYFSEDGSALADRDYTAVNAELVWEEGELGTRTFEIPILDNQAADGARTLQISFFSNAPGAQPFAETLTITDDDAPSVVEFIVADVEVRQDAGTVDLTVARSGSAGGAVSVDYVSVNGTATAGDDFLNAGGTLDWADGETGNRTITVTLQAGQLDPAGESFVVQLSNVQGPAALGANGAATVTIRALASGEVAFANAPLSVDETAGIATIAVDRINGSEGELVIPFFTAPLTAAAGVDYQDVTGSLVWADGDSVSKTFEIPIIDNQAVDGDRTLRVGLSLDQQAVLEETLTIVDDDLPSVIAFSVVDLEVDEDAGSVIATVVRGGGSASGVVTVDFATADGTATAGDDFAAATGTLTWNDGDTTDKQIEIEILAGQIASDVEGFTIVLSNATGPATLGSAAVATVSIGAAGATRDIAEVESLSPNQRQLANWFDQTCPLLEGSEGLTADQAELVELCDLVRDIDLTDRELEELLDAINPEEIFAASTAALRLTVAQHGNLSQRLNALRGGARGIDLSGLNLEIDGQVVAGQAIQEVFNQLVGGGASSDGESVWGRWGAFLNGRFSTGRKDPTENEAAFDYDLQGLTMGVDYRIRDNLIFGVAGGMGGVDSDYRGQAGGLDIESWNASAFLTYFKDETFYADALMTYGRNDYDSERNILLDTGFDLVDRTARGETDGSQFSLGFGFGWDFSRGAWTYGPHAGLYHYRVEVDGFAETGAGGLNLAIGDQEVESLTGNAGGHVSYAVLTGWGVLVPNARVDWVREFEDGVESMSYGFVNDPFVADANDPSPVITLRSDRPDTSYFIWSAGVSAQFIQGISGFVNYQTYTGYSNFSIREWNLGLRWEKTY